MDDSCDSPDSLAIGSSQFGNDLWIDPYTAGNSYYSYTGQDNSGAKTDIADKIGKPGQFVHYHKCYIRLKIIIY